MSSSDSETDAIVSRLFGTRRKKRLSEGYRYVQPRQFNNDNRQVADLKKKGLWGDSDSDQEYISDAEMENIEKPTSAPAKAKSSKPLPVHDDSKAFAAKPVSGAVQDTPAELDTGDVEKRLQEIRGILEELSDLAHAKKGEEVPYTHKEVVNKLDTMGEILDSLPKRVSRAVDEEVRDMKLIDSKLTRMVTSWDLKWKE
jgi:hypothetical protein